MQEMGYVSYSLEFKSKIQVNRNRTAQEALAATNCLQLIDSKVFELMPEVESEEVDIKLFSLDLSMYKGRRSVARLMQEYERRGLRPVDPITLAAANELEPSLAEQFPHSTCWKDTKGKLYHITFQSNSKGIRVVHSHRFCGSWPKYWLFAGVRV